MSFGISNSFLILTGDALGLDDRRAGLAPRLRVMFLRRTRQVVCIIENGVPEWKLKTHNQVRF
jgi:hypothetical protein